MTDLHVLPEGEGKGPGDPDPTETSEWLQAFHHLQAHHGEDRARSILARLWQSTPGDPGACPDLIQTPYVNSLSAD
jgi:pyruvate dehydrogenase complex dehydrogenase (E1) component